MLATKRDLKRKLKAEIQQNLQIGKNYTIVQSNIVFKT
jgi:hypothetical protein